MYDGNAAVAYRDNVIPFKVQSNLVSGDDKPRWFERAFQQVKNILALQENWNSYDALRVEPDLAIDALKFLYQTCTDLTPEPLIVPTQGGFIQIEWHTESYELEVVVKSEIELEAYFEEIDSGFEWERKFTYDLSDLSEAIGLLSEGR